MEKNVKDWVECTTPYTIGWFDFSFINNFFEKFRNNNNFLCTLNTIEGNFESSMPNDINTMLIQQVKHENFI
jgi:hypothetical protein